MRDTTLPDPLVPADVDLRGLEYMPFFGNHLFGSEFNARCSDAEWRAGVTLWWAAWNQQPAGSLPADDMALCRLADLGRDLKLWKRLKANALRGFVLCSDGRLYHEFLCKQVLVAWEKRVKEREKKRKWREGRHRDGDRDNPQQEPGQRPGQGGGQDGTGDRSVPADVTGRDVTGRDSTPTNQGKGQVTPSPASEIAAALLASGCPNGFASNPHVQQWAKDGRTPDDMREAVRIATEERGKHRPPTAYLVPIVTDMTTLKQERTAPSKTMQAINELEHMRHERRSLPS